MANVTPNPPSTTGNLKEHAMTAGHEVVAGQKRPYVGYTEDKLADLDEFPLVERFSCDGEPAFSAVGRVSAWVDSYDQAYTYGRRMVAIGNWRSFRIVKEFFPEEPTTSARHATAVTDFPQGQLDA